MGKPEKEFRVKKKAVTHKKSMEKMLTKLNSSNKKSSPAPPRQRVPSEGRSDDNYNRWSEYDKGDSECDMQSMSSKRIPLERGETESEGEYDREPESSFRTSRASTRLQYEGSPDTESDAEDEMEQDAQSENSNEDDDDFELEDKDENEIQNDLSKMSFAELQQLKERIGLKMYNEAVFGEQKQRAKRNFKRENKNRPREESSKRPVPVIRDTFPVKKKVSSDPRFDPRVGEYSERVFRDCYGFIGDLRHKERGDLEKMLRREKDPEQRKSIKKLLQRMKNQEATEHQKSRGYQLNEEYKKFVTKSMEEGVTPKYLSEKERRKIELAQRFKELKKSGKLEKYLEKRRRKNVRKERKYLPSDK